MGGQQAKIASNIARAFQTNLAIDSEEISFESLWDRYPPSEAEGQSLSEYIKRVLPLEDSFDTLFS